MSSSPTISTTTAMAKRMENVLFAFSILATDSLLR
jgi:hypothetical protein